MSIPTPAHMNEYIRAMLNLLDDLSDTYRSALDVGYTRSNSQGDKIKSSGVGDPVGETVVSAYHSHQRARVKRAAKLIYAAYSNLNKANAALGLVLGEDISYEEEGAQDAPLPSFLDAGEFKRLQAYQKKRKLLGEI